MGWMIVEAGCVCVMAGLAGAGAGWVVRKIGREVDRMEREGDIEAVDGVKEVDK